MIKSDVRFSSSNICSVIQFNKQMHALQIVVIQNMTSHCSLYDLEKNTLKTILFLLKLNASHFLKAFTQDLFMYFNQI